LALSPARRQDRLRDIIDAAKALLRERGGDGFSMGELAARAGVSPSTPYNRVGSKSDVLRLVVEEEFESFVVKLGALAPSSSPLRDLLAATDLFVVHYEGDRDFYRALYGTAFSAEARDTHDLMHAMGQTLWRGLVRKAAEAGELTDLVAVEPLTDALLRTLSAATLAWLAENWDHGRFANEMALSVRLVLVGVAASPLQTDLLADIRAAAGRLPASPD
jgi:AcrR family transcriptional regulator